MKSITGVISKALFALPILITAIQPHAIAQQADMFIVHAENMKSEYLSSPFITCEISSSESAFSLPDTPFQQKIASAVKGQRKHITLKSGLFPAPAAETDIKKYLANTRLLNLNSQEVKMLSQKLRNKSGSIAEIESFVDRLISDKTTGVPMMPAVNIIRSRTGDCTEHSVLTIAILRSLGIPSRGVVGMILVPEFMGEKNCYVYHMWAEALVDGKWVLVDSTRPGPKSHSRYIALAYHHLKSDMPLSVLRAMSSARGMKISILETASK